MPRTPLFYYNIVCSMNKNENILKKRIQNALGQTVFSGFTKIVGTTGKKGSIMNLLKFLRQSGEERTERVLTGKIYSTMLFLAVPSFLMLISQALATTFDNWFIYNFSTLTSGGVISYSVQAFNVIYNAGIGLSVAGTAILSRFNGQGDWRGSRHYTEQFLALMMLLSGALAVLTAVLAGFYASLALPELQSGIRLAMRLYAVSIPFAYFNNAYYAMKNAMGKSEIPFVFTFLMVGTKVLCNAIFVAVLDLGVLGIGLATICSHVVVSLFLVVDVFFHKKGMRLHFKGFRFDPSAIRTLLVVGIPSVINNMAMSVGFWLINLESMKFGNEILNSINIGNNISSLMYNLSSCFGTCVTTAVSLNLGAKQNKRARASAKSAIVMSTIGGMLGIVIIYLLGEPITRLFTTDPAILGRALTSQRISILGAPCFGICSVMCGVFIGFARTKLPILINVARVWLLRYIFILIAEALFTVNFTVIPWATVFSNTLTALFGWYVYRTLKWEGDHQLVKRKKEKTA